jgi:hypothetical protein
VLIPRLEFDDKLSAGVVEISGGSEGLALNATLDVAHLSTARRCHSAWRSAWR